MLLALGRRYDPRPFFVRVVRVGGKIPSPWDSRMKTLFRAVVMFGVLVGGPAAWMYYGPLPPSAQRAVDRFVAAAKETIDWEHLDFSSFAFDKRQAPKSARPLRAAARALPAAPPFDSSAEQTRAPSFADLSGKSAAATSSASTLAPKPINPMAELEPLLSRLRECQVVGYSLQRWGVSGEYYRFSCDMPLTSEHQMTEHFEAIAESPIAAVNQVVRDVAAWEAGRSGAERFARN